MLFGLKAKCMFTKWSQSGSWKRNTVSLCLGSYPLHCLLRIESHCQSRSDLMWGTTDNWFDMLSNKGDSIRQTIIIFDMLFTNWCIYFWFIYSITKILHRFGAKWVATVWSLMQSIHDDQTSLFNAQVLLGERGCIRGNVRLPLGLGVKWATNRSGAGNHSHRQHS